MPPADIDVTAPPAAPPDVHVPPPNVEPRTDRFDWIFVGYSFATVLVRNDPLPALKVAAADEVPAAVAAWLARFESGSNRFRARVHPYIWLAPELAQEFEDLATATLARGFTEGGADPALDVAVDFTRYDALRRAGFADDAADDAAYEDALRPLRGAGYEWPGDALGNYGGEWPLRHGTLRAILDAHCRAKVRAALYDHKHWYILLRSSAEDEAGLKRRDEPYLKTADGVGMRQEPDYRALAERNVLPNVAAARLVGWLRAQHDERANDECGAFPSDRTVAKWLREQAIVDPVATVVATPPPDGALADDVEREVGLRHDRSGKGSTVTGLARKLGRQKKAVGDAAKWLKAQGRLVLRDKLYWPRDD